MTPTFTLHLEQRFLAFFLTSVGGGGACSSGPEAVEMEVMVAGDGGFPSTWRRPSGLVIHSAGETSCEDPLIGEGGLLLLLQTLVVDEVPASRDAGTQTGEGTACFLVTASL